MSRKDVDKLSNDPDAQKIAGQLVAYLQELIRIPSPSGDEKTIAAYLIEWGKNQKGWSFHDDQTIRNVFCEPTGCKNEILPLLIVHSDTVNIQDHAEVLKSIEIADTVQKNGCIENRYGIPLGYDDKCGIALIMWLIANRPALKFRALVATQEEGCKPPYGKPIAGRTGGGGIQYALENRVDFFKQSRWGLLLDRAEHKDDYDTGNEPIIVEGIREEPSDIVWKYAGKKICSDSFIEQIEKITNSEGIQFPMRRVASGAKSDAMNIRIFPDTEGINLVNLATGVYYEHSNNEYVSIFETVRTLKVAEECLKRDKELSELA